MPPLEHENERPANIKLSEMWLPSIFAFFSEMEHYERALHRSQKFIRDTQKYHTDYCAEKHWRWKPRGCDSLRERRSRLHNVVTVPNAGK